MCYLCYTINKFGAKIKDILVKLTTHSSETGLTAELMKYTSEAVKLASNNKLKKSELCNFSQKLSVLNILCTVTFIELQFLGFIC